MPEIVFDFTKAAVQHPPTAYSVHIRFHHTRTVWKCQKPCKHSATSGCSSACHQCMLQEFVVVYQTHAQSLWCNILLFRLGIMQELCSCPCLLPCRYTCTQSHGVELLMNASPCHANIGTSLYSAWKVPATVVWSTIQCILKPARMAICAADSK